MPQYTSRFFMAAGFFGCFINEGITPVIMVTENGIDTERRLEAGKRSNGRGETRV